MFNKIKIYISSHKIISGIILIILILISYAVYRKYTSTTGDTRYVMAQVKKDTLIASVSGSGQVSASNQIDITSKVSGEITYIGVKNGQKVTSGTLIAKVDSVDAEKSIRDAEISLKSAQLSLEKLEIQNSTENISADLAKAYDDGFNTVTEVFLDLPATITGLGDMLGSDDLSSSTIEKKSRTAQSYRDTAEMTFYSAKKAFEKNRDDFRVLTQDSTPVEIENIINETYETEKLVADTIADFKILVDYLSEISDDNTSYTSEETSIASYASSTSDHLSSLLTAQNNIKSNKDAVPSANLDLQSSILSVQQKQNALQDAKDKLADYSIHAPFNGTITVVNIKKSDSISGSTVVATLITNTQLAEVSLNEIDVARIKVGQKATLTFDAFEGLTMTGQVIEVDAVGTVTQGVVSYEVKIGFDTQNANVKSGMTVNTSILTDVHQDVLEVPASAVKTQNGNSYVQVFDPEITDATITQGVTTKQTPKQIQVQVGISDDTNVEIISGLTEGQQIITRTISGTATTTTNSNKGSPARIF